MHFRLVKILLLHQQVLYLGYVRAGPGPHGRRMFWTTVPMHQGRLLIGYSLLAKYFHSESYKVDVAFRLDHNSDQQTVQKNVQVGVQRTGTTKLEHPGLRHLEPNEVQASEYDNVDQGLKNILVRVNGWE